MDGSLRCRGSNSNSDIVSHFNRCFILPIRERRLGEFASAAQESHEAQARIEATDREDFDSYLARYLGD